MNKKSFFGMLAHSIRYDLRCGIWKRWYWYVCVCLVNALLILNAGKIMELYQIKTSFMNILVALFQGCEEYNKSMEGRFEIPIAYMTFIIMNALVNGWYAKNEMSKRGTLSILRMQNMKIWWFSKCIWSFLNALIYCVILFLMTFLLNGILSHGAFGLDESIYRLLYIPEKYFNNKAILLYTLGSMLLLLIALNAVQLLLQLLCSPIIAMIAVIVIMVFSAFDYKVFYLGNYIMLMRNAAGSEGGIAFGMIAVICMLITIVCIGIGRCCLHKRDILV